MKKILFLISRQLCYGTAPFFAQQLIKEIKTAGVGCIYYELDMNGDLERQLNNFEGIEVEAVIDFNSLLPRLVCQDQTRFLDHIPAPFFNYVLDHPLYHHESLKVPLQNYHVLVIDEQHRQYIQQLYPHIKTADVLPLTGAACQREVKRQNQILFTGTYDDSEKYWTKIQQCPKAKKKELLQLVEYLEANPQDTLEKACFNCVVQPGQDGIVLDSLVEKQWFAEKMQSLYLADLYIRNHNREQGLKALIQAKLPVWLIGNGWNQWKEADQEWVTLHQDVSVEDTYYGMKKSKILYNPYTLFSGGLHDRVYSAMANGAVCLTPEQNFLSGKPEEQVLELYDLNQLKRMPEQAKAFMEDTQVWTEKSEAAKQCFEMYHTWKKRVEKLLAILAKH